MTEKRIRQILDGVAGGSMTPAAAFKLIGELPFEDLGFAKLDSHRSIRRGIPEAVFGEGKTADQLAAIGSSNAKFARWCTIATRGLARW